MTKYLTCKQVIHLQSLLITAFGGHPGIRDLNLLHSALDAPKASFHGKEMYPAIPKKAGVLLYHLAKNFTNPSNPMAYQVIKDHWA